MRKRQKDAILLRCAKCGKETTTPRADYDPPTATVMEDWCEKCADGSKVTGPIYYDALGRMVDWNAVRAALSLMPEDSTNG